MLIAIIFAAALLFVAMLVAYVVQRNGRSVWIDVIWSGATGLACLIAIVGAAGDALGRTLLLSALVSFWSLRLVISLTQRALRSSEDPRYKALREEWGASVEPKMFMALQAQAIASTGLAIGVAAAASNPAPFPQLLDGVAALVAIGAVLGGAIADNQLTRFRLDPANRGKVCEEGLWGYTRHPNYFFEWLWWCTIPIIAFAGFAVSWLTFLALLPPVMMYVLLNYGSGIPPLEKHMLASRGEAYERVQQRVNAFFPGPRRKG
ncbi:MAG: DUF1295 domain-containing protein [Pseudomonadota bacterium]